MSNPKYQIWQCQIGAPYFDVAKGADSPMRAAVQTAFENIMTPGGYHVPTVEKMFCFSNWNGSLSAQQLATVQNKPLFREQHQYLISPADLAVALIQRDGMTSAHANSIAIQLVNQILKNRDHENLNKS